MPPWVKLAAKYSNMKQLHGWDVRKAKQLIDREKFAKIVEKHGTQPGQITFPLVEDVRKFEPRVKSRTSGFTQIHEDVTEEGIPILFSRDVAPNIRAPEKEARDILYKNPEHFVQGRSGGGTYNVRKSKGPDDPADIGHGIAYEYEQNVPIKSDRAQGQYLLEKTNPIVDALTDSQHASAIWTMFKLTEDGRFVGSTPATQLWKRYWQTCKNKKLRDNIPSARAYFFRSFNAWRENPNKFKKVYTREGKILPEIWQHYINRVPEGRVK